MPLPGMVHALAAPEAPVTFIIDANPIDKIIAKQKRLARTTSWLVLGPGRFSRWRQLQGNHDKSLGICACGCTDVAALQAQKQQPQQARCTNLGK